MKRFFHQKMTRGNHWLIWFDLSYIQILSHDLTWLGVQVWCRVAVSPTSWSGQPRAWWTGCTSTRRRSASSRCTPASWGRCVHGWELTSKGLGKRTKNKLLLFSNSTCCGIIIKLIYFIIISQLCEYLQFCKLCTKNWFTYNGMHNLVLTTVS